MSQAPEFAREPPVTATRWLTVLWWHMRGTPVPVFYLRTKRGTTYRVHTVKRCRPGAQARYRFGVQRVATQTIPTGATVHGWSWAPRRRRAA